MVIDVVITDAIVFAIVLYSIAIIALHIATATFLA